MNILEDVVSQVLDRLPRRAAGQDGDREAAAGGAGHREVGAVSPTTATSAGPTPGRRRRPAPCRGRAWRRGRRRAGDEVEQVGDAEPGGGVVAFAASSMVASPSARPAPAGGRARPAGRRRRPAGSGRGRRSGAPPPRARRPGPSPGHGPSGRRRRRWSSHSSGLSSAKRSALRVVAHALEQRARQGGGRPAGPRARGGAPVAPGAKCREVDQRAVLVEQDGAAGAGAIGHGSRAVTLPGRSPAVARRAGLWSVGPERKAPARRRR